MCVCVLRVILIINNDLMFKCSLLFTRIDCDMKYLKGFIYIHSFIFVVHIVVVVVVFSSPTFFYDSFLRVGTTKNIKHSSYNVYTHTHVIGMRDFYQLRYICEHLFGYFRFSDSLIPHCVASTSRNNGIRIKSI